MGTEIKHCFLYKIKSKKRLASLFGVNLPDLLENIKHPQYNVFEKNIRGKKREIEQPLGILNDIHKKIHRLIRDINMPEWVFSGKKGFSHIDNCLYHFSDKIWVVKTDIKKFYRSAKLEYVFRFFKNTLCMSDDCALLMAKLLTKDGHLPTGSPSSQIVAYWAYSKCFMEINEYASKKSIKMSLFVDDMVFSSDGYISREFVWKIQKMLEGYGLTINKSKTKYYGSRKSKKITGVVISPDGKIKVPNNMLKKIDISERKKEKTPKEETRYKGLLAAKRQIELKLRPQISRN